MKTILLVGWGSAVFALVPGPVNAAEPSPAEPRGNSLPNLVTIQKSEPTKSAGLLTEVEKMLKAGTDPGVIKAFVQSWPGQYAVTVDEVLHLRDIGASTDILTAVIHRSGELAAEASQSARTASLASAQASGLGTTNLPSMIFPDTNMPPAVIYPYPSSYPANTYSYLYPDVGLSYGYWPSYSLYDRWPSYGFYGRGYYPLHRFPPRSFGWRDHGFPGRGGPWDGGRGFPHGGGGPGSLGHGHR